MNISSVLPSHFYRTCDIRFCELKLQISHVGMVDLGSEHKPILYFEDRDKGLLLDNINAKAIAEEYGPDTNEWEGRVISLFVTERAPLDDERPCIRVTFN